MPVNNPFALTAGIQYVDGTASTATSFTGTVAMSFNASNLIVGLRSDANDNLLVTGTLTHNNAAPIANNFGVLPAVASSAAPTYNAGDQVLLSTDLAGNLRVNATFTGTATNNITQWNSVNLGSPSAYGTSPGAVNVIGVNAFVTNTVAVSGTVTVNQGTSPWVVSLTSTTITGTVAVTQSTSPWVVAGALTNNNAAPTATLIGVMDHIAETAYATVTYTTGDVVLATTDLHGATNVDLQAYAGTALGAGSNYGTSPGAVNVMGVNAFITNTVPVTLTSTTITGTVAVTQSTSPWVVSLASTTITGTVAVTQSTSPWVVSLASTTITGTVTAVGNLTNNNAAPTATLQGVLPAIAETAYTTVTYTTGDMVLPVTDLHGALNQDLQAYAGTQLTGTVTAYGTAPTGNVFGVNAFIPNTVPVTLTSTTITGTVAVTQSTSPWVVSGNLTHNNAAPAANNVGVLPAVASTAAPTYTTGDQVLLSTDLAGNLRVTFAAASEQNVNLNQWAGTNLGTPTAYGTSPGAVVAGSVNAFVTNTVATTLASTTITGTVAVTQSTSPWVDNLTQVAGVALGATGVTAFGTAPAAANVMGVNASLFAGGAGLTPATFGTTAAGTGLLTNASLFIGTTVAVAASAGVQKVGISGATGVTLDAAQNAAAPANELVVGAVFNTTTPALTAGNASQLQADSTGALQVNTEGKKQSYRCGIISFGPLASSSPTISVTGSATKTIRITRIRLSVAATAGAICDVSLKRFSTLTGGTSASQSANIAKLDTNNAAATAVVNLYTAAATTATAAGVLAAERYEIVTASVSVAPQAIEWDFSNMNAQACVLRGTGDFVGFLFSAIGTTPNGDCWIEWTEE